MPKITPFLWFDNNAEEAIKFYTSVFKRSKIGKITRYTEGAPVPAGTFMTGTFQIEGQEFVALNGGPIYKFTEAISFVVNCKTQKEVDQYWKKRAVRLAKRQVWAIVANRSEDTIHAVGRQRPEEGR
jgi:predicted 3-demethylubiquinone-9 3-methyltransferase (glyoxalase superfamily)